jgi:acyl-CoA synthetase (AMP-forming)/AMP-acid ligase II
MHTEAPPATSGWVAVTSLGDLLVRGAGQHPDRAALVMPGTRRTYAELLEGARQVARGLWALGIRRGDHVGILMPNCVEFVEAFFGTALLGAVVVPIHARYREAELGYVIENADLACLLTTDLIDEHVDFAALLRRSLPGLGAATDSARLQLAGAPRLRTVVTLRGSGGDGLLGRAEFDALAAEADSTAADVQRFHVRVRDVATIIYTSGTTSNPKGCMLTHEAVVRSAAARARERLTVGDHDVYWSAGPLFHIGSLAPFLACMDVAGTYLTATHYEPGEALAMMEREGVTSAWPLFPAIVQALLTHPDFDPEALRELTSLVLVGPAALLHRTQERLPQARLVNACGMTETAAMYALSGLDDSPAERAETGGTPLRGIEVRIIDVNTGEDVPDGTVGEILVRGYPVMEGYHRDPVKTAEALDEDGWLHTSDLYVREPRGHYTFFGRLKDMLKVGGENVAAVEIEAFLSQHPAVRLAEVVGMPDERLDEVPVAFVELHAGRELAEEDLIEFCRGRIAGFKIPHAVRFVAPGDWPMSATKVDKGALRRALEVTL